MIKSLFSLIFALFSVVGAHEEVVYTWEETPDVVESKQVFVDAFRRTYARVPLSQLQQSSYPAMIEWLEETFDQTYADFLQNNHRRWISAHVNGKVVGMLVIDIANYPQEIYLAQMAIDPAYQREKIGSRLVQEIYETFPACKRLVAISRYANLPGRAFLKACGFKPVPYMYPGYSAELYSGFELPLPH